MARSSAEKESSNRKMSGLGDERPSDGEALTLAARQVAAALRDRAVEAVRERLHETRRLGDLERIPELSVGGVGPGESQVRRNGAGEEERALRHVSDRTPQHLGASSRTSTPPTSTSPSVASMRRATSATSVLLPAPVEPMIANVSPARTLTDTCSSTACSAPGYRSPASRSSTVPGSVMSCTGCRRGTTEGRVSTTSKNPLGGNSRPGDHRDHERGQDDRHHDLGQIAEIGDQRPDLGRRRGDPCRLRSRARPRLPGSRSG